MKFFAGCDVGSLTAKAVLIHQGRIVGAHVVKSRTAPQLSADAAMRGALAYVGADMKDISRCVGTGYGREHIDFVTDTVSEITCHAKGANWLMNSARTIIDIGGQDCKAMRIDAKGQVIKFVTNDKCASGTGRFLDVMARVLGVSIEELSLLTRKAAAPATLASTCTVWAQADVIKLLNSGVEVANIGAGVNTAMASRIAILVSSVHVEKDICMTGGVAKNVGVVETLAKILGSPIKVPRKADPQIAGAIGAALIAETLS